jgi:hypothetical protein
MSATGNKLILTGLDGSNPLAFLAALGTLRLLSLARGESDFRLSWESSDGRSRAVLHSSRPMDRDEVLQSLDVALSQSKNHHLRLAALGDDLSIAPDRFRHVACSETATGWKDRPVADFLAAFGCDATANERGDVIQDTAFRTMAGAGHQHFLGFMRNIGDATTSDHLLKTLFADWEYDDPVEKLTLRWDPCDDTRYALQWRNPSGDPQRRKGGNMLGANRLAIEALPLFPTAPVGRHLATTGFRGRRSRDTFWTWPIWNPPASLDVVRSLVSLQELQEPEIKPVARQTLLGYGIIEIYRVQRLTIGKVRNFSPSVSL